MDDNELKEKNIQESNTTPEKSSEVETTDIQGNFEESDSPTSLQEDLSSSQDTISSITLDKESSSSASSQSSIESATEDNAQNVLTVPSDFESDIQEPEEHAKIEQPIPSPIEEPYTEESAIPPGKIFHALSCAAPLILIFLSAILTFAEVWHVRELWFSDEVRLADVFMNCRAGDWLALTLNGMPYPDKPPLYFWFIQSLTYIPTVSVTAALFLASAISYALFVLSVWFLAVGTGHNKYVAFAAGLITLSCLFVGGLASTLRMDLLFSAVIVFGMTCLYRGWKKQCAPIWLLLGFSLLGLATLIKGPLGIAFGIITTILFLIWIWRPRRLNGWDGLPGFFSMIVIVSAWLVALYSFGHADYLSNMFGVQLGGRLSGHSTHIQPWWYYFVVLGIVAGPWILLLFFINWWKVLKNIPTAWKTRRENSGGSWLWIWFITGFALLSVIPAKLCVYIVPILPPLAVLTARAVLNLTEVRSRILFGLFAIFFLLFGLLLGIADFYPFIRDLVPTDWIAVVPQTIAHWLEAVDGIVIMGGLLIVLSMVLILFTDRSKPSSAIFTITLFLTLLFPVFQYAVAPSLESVLSPHNQAVFMADKIKQGYAPAAYKVYPGTYTWHINKAIAQDKRISIPDFKSENELNTWIEKNQKAVIAMPQEVWDKWTTKPANASVKLHAWIFHKPYVIIITE